MERYGKKSSGFDHDAGAFSAAEHFTREVAQLVRPELLNRIDRIVPFRPLSPETLRKILDRELSLLMRRQGITARPLTLEIDDAVKEELVRLGYDPRYGARPLRRTLERELLLPLAELLADLPLEEPLTVRFTLEEGKIRVKNERMTDKERRKAAEALSKDKITQRALWRLAGYKHALDRGLCQSFLIKSFRRDEHDWRLNQERLKEKLDQNNEAWRYYQQRENDKYDKFFETKNILITRKMLDWLDQRHEELSVMEKEMIYSWERGQAQAITAEEIEEKEIELYRRLYLEGRPDKMNTSFWFISQRLDFLLFYVRLFDEFCEKYHCPVQFWTPQNYGEPLAKDAPEFSENGKYYPWALIDYRKGIPAEPFLAQVRQERGCPKEYRKEGTSVSTLWKMPRDQRGKLVWPDSFRSGDRVRYVLMTGVEDPYLRRLFTGLTDRHRGSYKKVKFNLDFFAAGKNLTDFCDYDAFKKIIDTPGYLNIFYKDMDGWEFSGSGKQGAWIPWKTAKLICRDKFNNDYSIDGWEYTPDNKETFPNTLFESDLGDFIYTLNYGR